jgi:serine/threonine-protein kinase
MHPADASATSDANATDGARATDDASRTNDAGSPPNDAAVAAPRVGRYFPEGAFMYQPVDSAPLDPDSARVTGWLRDNGGFGTGRMRIDFSIEVLTAAAGTMRRSFERTSEFYTPDCDPAPIPVPAGGALEGESGYACSNDGDCHLIVVDRAQQRLYEMWRANIVGTSFSGGCAAIWDMTRVYGPEGRGDQCSSADAAGFPIAPLLFSADELAVGQIDHAIRFILPNERMRARTYQRPATHAGGPSGPADAPIYGSRWRLKASFNLASLPNEGARVVARALQRYGMVLADGGNIALTAQSDRFTTNKWMGRLGSNDLQLLQPSDFEIVQTGEPIALTFDCKRSPIAN